MVVGPAVRGRTPRAPLFLIWTKPVIRAGGALGWGTFRMFESGASASSVHRTP
jgi:hypothetical protein